SGSQVQVMNYDGEALLSNADRRSQFVPVGQSVAVQVDTGAFTAAPTLANLLGETGFSSENVIDYNAAGTSPTRPLVWRCNNVQDAPPVGSYALTIREGRPALSFLRGDGAQSHGETRCWQGLGTGAQGLDVSMFSHMSIRATFQIANQTLSACGDQGSECPLMLAMDYIPYEPINDQNPVNTWYHGFYAFVDPNRVYPQLCQSCIEQHENINPGVWYT